MVKLNRSNVRSNPNLVRQPFLPPRARTASPQAKTGFATYYLSCTVRFFTPFTEKAERHHQRGFRGALLAPVGLVFDSPEMLVGYQLGDTFQHAMDWVSSNPLEEMAMQPKPEASLKVQAKVQKRFADAVATLEGVELARRDAEAELEAATAEIITVQGVEIIVIDGVYYDPSYSHEKVYLKRRHPSFTPAAEEPEPVAKPAKKRRRRAA